MPLAWLSKYVQPNSQAQFSWEQNYSFVAGQSGELRPGAKFNVNQTYNADPVNQNEISLSDNGGYLQFSNPTRGYQQNVFSIKTSSGISRQGDVAVGISMSESPVFVSQAQPNMNYNFQPGNQYFIAFGKFEQGEVLNVRSISNAAKLEFSQGVSSLKAELNPNNTWSISKS
jgi:hypothetical protein